MSDGRGWVCVRALALATLIVAASAPRAGAYSVLAHEATIDALWKSTIVPLILERYPGTSTDALLQARAYAYGGSVIQDLGYYPFGSHFFSNLLHYTRSGDFVGALIREARDPNEFAFAIGALAHYADDNAGHPEAVNRAVPLIFPKLREKYGDRVTYAQGPKEHIIVEFSFDVVQAAAGAYVPDSYKAFIGFEVAKPLLERVFREIYGLELSALFMSEGLALGTYRYSVSQTIPAITTEAWKTKEDEIARLTPGVERSAFVFSFSRADYERAYGTEYQRPGWFARFLAFLYKLVPKIGPLKPLSFKAPTPETEAFFAESFRTSKARFAASLAAVHSGTLHLSNTNFDTGRPARHGDYTLADDTYAELLDKQASHRFQTTPAALAANILEFYGSQPQPSAGNGDDRKHWKKIAGELQALMDAAPASGGR